MKAGQKTKAPWRCPKCGREFAQRLTFHSCGNYTVEGYLQRKNPAAVALFQALVKTTQACGNFTLSPAKTQIIFRGRVAFLMVSLAGKRLVGYLFLNRAVPLGCFKKVKAVSSSRHVHVFQIADEATLRGEFAQVLAEAHRYATHQEDEKPNNKSGRKIPSPRIGEEINAIYRQARSQQQAVSM